MGYDFIIYSEEKMTSEWCYSSYLFSDMFSACLSLFLVSDRLVRFFYLDFTILWLHHIHCGHHNSGKIFNISLSFFLNTKSLSSTRSTDKGINPIVCRISNAWVCLWFVILFEKHINILNVNVLHQICWFWFQSIINLLNQHCRTPCFSCL